MKGTSPHGLLDSFIMGAGNQKDQATVGSIELSAPFHLIFQERERARDRVNN